MYAGRVVEQAGVEQLFADPAHPYTQGLLRSLPRFDQSAETLQAIPGQPPDLGNLPPGCAYRDRCPIAIEVCKTNDPKLVEIDGGRKLACHATRENANV